MAVRYRSPIWRSGSSASPRSLASPVRRGQSEAASDWRRRRSRIRDLVWRGWWLRRRRAPREERDGNHDGTTIAALRNSLRRAKFSATSNIRILHG